MTADERDLERLVDEIDYGEEPDDDEFLKKCRTKSMFKVFIPKFLKRKLNENLELKITRQRLFE
jgi:hypothetical protein